MFKLISTTAIIAITATSASAWTDAKTIINNLHDTYEALDGDTQFGTLAGKDGALTQFADFANQGVTHIALTVDDNNVITADVTPGKTLGEIQQAGTDLVNRVNYDLFVDTVGDGASFQTGVNYQTKGDLEFTPVAGSAPERVGQNYTGAGLVGIKVDKLITGVDTINTVLLGTDPLQADERNSFLTNWGDGTNGTGSVGGVDISVVQGHIAGLNKATGIIGGTAGDNSINEGLNGIVVDDATLSGFAVPGLNLEDGSVQIESGGYYASLADWATGTTSTPPAP